MSATKLKKIRTGVATRRTAGALTAKKAIERSPVEQPENYGFSINLVRRGAAVLIKSGCHLFTFEEARAHWTARAKTHGSMPDCGNLGCTFQSCLPRTFRARARKMLILLPILAQRARRYGWTKSRTTKTEGTSQ